LVDFSGVLVDCFFPHPITNKPVIIVIGVLITERSLPHHPDSRKFRELVVESTV
jgi:hypothetical protein